ncbi:hypothetical protein P5673_032063 [Acropora cervicornis]|uniref:Uncharacterized protein n=1 Tax=Acropora cervicornis TaxID=6130 RepID=A0AAD9PRR8_ACRCE|nr:hypothetical protein P5673_032063 [Acropora cervicornis]
MEDCTSANQQKRCTYPPKMEEGKRKAAKRLKSVLKDGKKYAEELDVAFTKDETKATLTSQGRRPKTKLIEELLTPKVNNRNKTKYNNQKWLGALTTLQYDDVAIVADSLALLQTWKNIPDMVLSVNTSIKQQILLTAAKRNTN